MDSLKTEHSPASGLITAFGRQSPSQLRLGSAALETGIFHLSLRPNWGPQMVYELTETSAI